MQCRLGGLDGPHLGPEDPEHIRLGRRQPAPHRVAKRPERGRVLAEELLQGPAQGRSRRLLGLWRHSARRRQPCRRRRRRVLLLPVLPGGLRSPPGRGDLGGRGEQQPEPAERDVQRVRAGLQREVGVGGRRQPERREQPAARGRPGQRPAPRMRREEARGHRGPVYDAGVVCPEPVVYQQVRGREPLAVGVAHLLPRGDRPGRPQPGGPGRRVPRQLRLWRRRGIVVEQVGERHEAQLRLGAERQRKGAGRQRGRGPADLRERHPRPGGLERPVVLLAAHRPPRQRPA